MVPLMEDPGGGGGCTVTLLGPWTNSIGGGQTGQEILNPTLPWKMVLLFEKESTKYSKITGLQRTMTFVTTTTMEYHMSTTNTML